MKIVNLPAVFMALAIAGCGSPEVPATPEDTLVAENTALDLISERALRAHVEYLASDELEGRMTGEPGYDQAAQYVIDHFEKLGLEPGGTDGWYQPVTLQSYLIDTESPALIAHRDGEDIELRYREHYKMYGDKVRPENTIRGEVVYVGYGIHAPEFGYSDYEGVDVAGKIVVAFGGAPDVLPHNERAYYSSSRVKGQTAVERGAIGWIAIRSRRDAERYKWERVQKAMGKKPGMTWLSVTGEADGFFPEIQGVVLLSAATAENLFDGTPISFEEARDAAEASNVLSMPLGFEVTMSRATIHDQLESPNVIGIVRGTDPELANEYVVFSGHLDHVGRGVPDDSGDDIYNGMYDNAMGISLLLESARAFAANPPRRSIMFIALTGEERGLLGSDYFAHYPTVPIESIVANVNLDMPLFLYPVADLVAFGSEHSSLEGVVSRAAEAEGFFLSPDPIPEENLFRRSDQYSFVRKGVPAIYLVPGQNSTDPDIEGADVMDNHILNHYHRPSDDLSRPVDWDSAVRFSRVNGRIGYEVANSELRPTWNEGDFFGDKFAQN